MTTFTLSQILVPTFTKGLKTLDHILTKAEQYAKEKGLDADAEYPDARLVADMRPFSFQVQNATNAVKKTLSRVTGQETEVWADDEQTVAELHARIKKALALLGSVDAGRIDARAEETVELPLGVVTLKLSAKDSAMNQGIPNFFFHVQTAYAILRAKGVPIGKVDYLTSFLAE